MRPQHNQVVLVQDLIHLLGFRGCLSQDAFKLEGVWVQGTPCPIYNHQVSLYTTNGETLLVLSGNEVWGITLSACAHCLKRRASGCQMQEQQVYLSHALLPRSREIPLRRVLRSGL